MTGNKQYIGTRLKKDIISQQGTLLLSADTILTKDVLDHLSALNYTLQAEDVEEVTNESRSEALIQNATDDIKLIFDQIRFKRSIPLHDIQTGVIPSIQEVVETQHVSTLLKNLQTKDEYTYRHTIGVSILSTLIGKWLKLSPAELAQLTVAATLHDIGMSKISKEILNKPEKLTPEEYEVLKKHTIYGYELIKNTVGTSHRVALVALQHHEREDGSGYPFKLKSNKIEFFSKIVAVADTFHSMSSERAFRDANPFYKVIDQMYVEQFGKLDATIVKVFVEKLMGTMVNHDVSLNDGRIGRIILIHPSDPIRPMISVDGEFIDLRFNKEIKIEKLCV